MPAAIFDLDLWHLPPAVTVPERYDRVLILIRLHGQPVGQALLPVAGGRIGGAGLRNALTEAAGWPLWERWLHDYLVWEEPPATHSTLPTATVAVCTRDRPEDLHRCFEALLRLPDDGQEYLVVDNCPSTDTTRRLVERYGHIRYVCEKQPGLDVARNRALREAHHEIVAFTDDDATPDPGWLRALLRNFDDPLVLCVTGLTMPLELETEAQEWFERYSTFRRGFRRTIFDMNNLSPLAAGRAGAGANMALRRNVIERVGLFDEALDAGTPTRSLLKRPGSVPLDLLLAEVRGCAVGPSAYPSSRRQLPQRSHNHEP